MARDMGTTRIPVTGERHGADFETPLFAFQVKKRRRIPTYVAEWLAGIRAARPDKIGVLVMQQPGGRDDEALVVLAWKDWVDLHGGMK